MGGSESEKDEDSASEKRRRRIGALLLTVLAALVVVVPLGVVLGGKAEEDPEVSEGTLVIGAVPSASPEPCFYYNVSQEC